MRTRNGESPRPPDDENRQDPPKLGEPSEHDNDDISRRAVGKLFQEPTAANAEPPGTTPGDNQARRRMRADAANPEESAMPRDDYNADGTRPNEDEYGKPRRRDPSADRYPSPDEERPAKEYVKIDPPRPTGRPGREGEEPDGQPSGAPRRRPGAPPTVVRSAGASRTPVPVRNNPGYDRDGERPRGRNSDSFIMNPPVISTPRIIAAVVAVILIFIISLLAYRVSAANKKLAAETEKLSELTSLQVLNENLTLENIRLKEDVSRLEEELEAASTQAPPFDADDWLEGLLADSEGDEEPPEPEPPESNAGVQTTYEVKAGDMLGKIAQEFYGDSGKHTLIMEANGLTSTNIRVGQKLIIPPLN